jgi:hypothetical protein
MKRVLLSVCLMAATVCAPTNLHTTPALNPGAGDVMSKATLLSHPCVQSTEQDEEHAVRSRYAESHIVIIRFPRHVG